MQNDELCPYDACFLPQQALQELVRTLPTPFYLYDEAGLRKNAQSIAAAFSWNRGYRQFFPIRLTPNPTVLRILREEGCGVQCSGLVDLLLAERCGFYGDMVIYAPMFPEDEALTCMRRLGATLLIDNVQTAEYCASRNMLPKRVMLRYNPGGKFSVGVQTLARLDRSKLGMPAAGLIALVTMLRKNGVEWIGLQVDLAKQVEELDYYAAAAELLCELAHAIHTKTGIPVAALNLGGGLGIGYLAGQASPDIAVIGERTRKMLQAGAGENTFTLQTTIGRYLTGPAAIFVARVLCVKRTHRNYVVLDATPGNFMRTKLGAYHHISVVGKTRNAGRVYCDVVGRLGESDGRFAERRMLPQVEPGDCCVVHDAGYCGSAMESHYGGTPRCAEYLYTIDGQACLIRKAQSLTELYQAW